MAALAASPPAAAQTAAASATPGTFNASLQATLPTTLVWTVRLTAPAGARVVVLPTTATSTQATVSTPGGQVLQVYPLALTVRLTGVVTSAVQGNAPETFRLAPAAVAAAQKLGVNTLRLTRTFNAGVGPNGAPYMATATVSIGLGGSASGPLTLSAVALHFDDRTLVRVLRQGESAVAVAEITYTGNGLFSGLWEVAAPPSTQGQPVFVPLGAASTNLSAGGTAEVTSPALPSSLAGTYYVRFRVRSPVVSFQSLVLRYGVEQGPAIPPIAVTSPEPHATFKPDTRFSWQPAPGATAYRLEFYAADASPDYEPP
ncbi:MAG TPA: hypothetical protein VGR80_12775, partial [Steroidobacteraceae bacterium]|nr:hypothetical protein [Steroidobacteraceae bacterium]